MRLQLNSLIYLSRDRDGKILKPSVKQIKRGNLLTNWITHEVANLQGLQAIFLNGFQVSTKLGIREEIGAEGEVWGVYVDLDGSEDNPVSVNRTLSAYPSLQYSCFGYVTASGNPTEDSTSHRLIFPLARAHTETEAYEILAILGGYYPDRDPSGSDPFRLLYGSPFDLILEPLIKSDKLLSLEQLKADLEAGTLDLDAVDTFEFVNGVVVRTSGGKQDKVGSYPLYTEALNREIHRLEHGSQNPNEIFSKYPHNFQPRRSNNPNVEVQFDGDDPWGDSKSKASFTVSLTNGVWIWFARKHGTGGLWTDYLIAMEKRSPDGHRKSSRLDFSQIVSQNVDEATLKRAIKAAKKAKKAEEGEKEEKATQLATELETLDLPKFGSFHDTPDWITQNLERIYEIPKVAGIGSALLTLLTKWNPSQVQIIGDSFIGRNLERGYFEIGSIEKAFPLYCVRVAKKVFPDAPSAAIDAVYDLAKKRASWFPQQKSIPAPTPGYKLFADGCWQDNKFYSGTGIFGTGIAYHSYSFPFPKSDRKEAAKRWLFQYLAALGLSQEDSQYLVDLFAVIVWSRQNDCKVQKTLFLVGEGGSGKSRLFQLILGSLLEDEAFVTSPEINRTLDGNFWGATLDNRHAIFFDEANYLSSRTQGLLKQLIVKDGTSSGLIYDVKYSQPRPMVFSPFICFASEVYPNIRVTDEGWRRRLILLEVTKNKKELTKLLSKWGDKLRDALLAYFLSYDIETAVDNISENFQTISDKGWNKLRMRNDKVYQFLVFGLTWMHPDDDDRPALGDTSHRSTVAIDQMRLREVFEEFRRFSNRNNFKHQLEFTHFAEDLFRLLPIVLVEQGYSEAKAGSLNLILTQGWVIPARRMVGETELNSPLTLISRIWDIESSPNH